MDKGDTVPGYLLDSNHVHNLFQKHPGVILRAAAVPDAQLRTSAITLGEIEGGHRMAKTTNQARRDEYTAWINLYFLVHVCPVTANTRTYYGEIIGHLWNQHPAKTRKQKTERHLVADLSIDINDVWITALAWEHGLTLVTHDGMEKLRPTVERLGLKIEDWM